MRPARRSNHPRPSPWPAAASFGAQAYTMGRGESLVCTISRHTGIRLALSQACSPPALPVSGTCHARPYPRPPPRRPVLGRRLGCPGKERPRPRLHGPGRLGVVDRCRHPGLRPALRTDPQPAPPGLLGRPARQAGQRRTGCRADALWPGLRHPPGHRQPGHAHGHPHGPEPERPVDQPEHGAARGRRDLCRGTARAYAPQRCETHLRPHLPHRHPCPVAVLLAGRPRHPSAH
ncbi:hypothetical protein D3C84_285800 [compost metagenome]